VKRKASIEKKLFDEERLPAVRQVTALECIQEDRSNVSSKLRRSYDLDCGISSQRINQVHSLARSNFDEMGKIPTD